jgi:hypothetical protein
LALRPAAASAIRVTGPRCQVAAISVVAAGADRGARRRRRSALAAIVVRASACACRGRCGFERAPRLSTELVHRAARGKLRAPHRGSHRGHARDAGDSLAPPGGASSLHDLTSDVLALASTASRFLGPVSGHHVGGRASPRQARQLVYSSRASSGYRSTAPAHHEIPWQRDRWTDTQSFAIRRRRASSPRARRDAPAQVDAGSPPRCRRGDAAARVSALSRAILSWRTSACADRGSSRPRVVPSSGGRSSRVSIASAVNAPVPTWLPRSSF